MIDKNREDNWDFEKLRAEAEILKEQKHPNIVKWIGVQESEAYIYIVMELIEGGRLSKLISDREKQSKLLLDDFYY